MRYANLLMLLIFSFTISYAHPPVQKSFVTIENGYKYVIKITEYDDGHKEQFITAVPLSEYKNFNPLYQEGLPVRDIEWDENRILAGNQISFEGSFAIENAFNNALAETEEMFGLAAGSYGRIELDPSFYDHSEDVQSFILINELKKAFTKHSASICSLPLEGVERNISNKSINDANRLLFSAYSDFSKGVRPYFLEKEDAVNLDHAQNNALIISDDDRTIAIPHIRAIYQWIFADAASNWYHRELLLHENKQKIEDDYHIKGAEGLLGLAVVNGILEDVKYLNQTGKYNASAICLNVVDPKKEAKFCYQVEFSVKDQNQGSFPIVIFED